MGHWLLCPRAGAGTRCLFFLRKIFERQSACRMARAHLGERRHLKTRWRRPFIPCFMVSALRSRPLIFCGDLSGSCSAHS